jgi:phosphotransferase system enzyme I (PtsP)
MALLGLGFRSISMAPASVGPVKSMVLTLDCSKLKKLMKPLVAGPAPSLRPELVAFAREHDIPV